MNWQFKKIVSILLAVLVGVGIIFAAWETGVYSDSKSTLSSTDNTNWRDALNVVPQDEPIKTLSATGKNIDPLITEATTTTTALAQRLLVESISAQEKSADGQISDKEATRIANLLAQGVVTQAGRQYTLSDLNLSQDNSKEANTAYISTVNALVKKHMDTEKEENELSILLSAMDTGDATILNKLDAKAVLYEQLLAKFLALKTPSGVAPIHLHLLQGFEALHSSTLKFKNALLDPAAGLAAISEYSNGVAIVSSLQKEYNDYFSKQ